MSEQELRDCAEHCPTAHVNYIELSNCHAEFVRLDNDKIVLRIMRDGDDVYPWIIAGYAHAASIIQWAESGDNQKGQGGE